MMIWSLKRVFIRSYMASRASDAMTIIVFGILDPVDIV